MKRFLSLLFAVLLVMTVLLPVSAQADYSYTIRVFAGNMGTVNGGDVAEFTGLSYGEPWTFDMGTVKLTNDKYYVKGIRQSGLDNDTVSKPAFTVTQDMDYVVAYGVKGDEVAYTVSFVRDSDGAELAPPVTFYGNVGDKPVVACRFIDNYYPRYYNITGTLSENAAANQFVFRYAPIPTEAGGTNAVGAPPVIIPAQGNADRPANGNQNAGNGNGGNGTGIGEGPVQASEQGGEAFPPEPESILDMDVPQAEAESQGGENNKLPGWIVLLLALAAAGLISIPFVVRILRKNGKNEEADQLEKAYEEELKKKEDKK